MGEPGPKGFHHAADSDNVIIAHALSNTRNRTQPAPGNPGDPGSLPAFTPQQARVIRRKLLAWYRKGHRAMPWRPRKLGNDTGNARIEPYYTLVSEAMLQQTQVATVIAYFERFIAEFPTVHALAEADEQRVLRQWQGLGYYRRARNLHAAAKMIVAEFDGRVPDRVEQLLKLPGVGRYTAGAIASIAYDRPAPIVDGNVDRVLARLLNLREPVDKPAVKKHVWSLAEQLVPPHSGAGDFNQSLMELGATVCTPKSPKCLVCPVRGECMAFDAGDPEQLPVKLPKKKPVAVTHLVIAVERGGKYLFEQRPATGLWSNMWQLPTWETPPTKVIDSLPFSRPSTGGATSARNKKPKQHTPSAERVAVPATASNALLAWFTTRFNLTLTNLTRAADFPHQTTHRTIRFVVLRGKAVGRLKPNTGTWRALDQLDDLPLPNPQQTAIKHLS
jgi:A/G-specific adenine glycosylase